MAAVLVDGVFLDLQGLLVVSVEKMGREPVQHLVLLHILVPHIKDRDVLSTSESTDPLTDPRLHQSRGGGAALIQRPHVASIALFNTWFTLVELVRGQITE